MNSPTIYHSHDGSVVELKSDCWPQENIGLTTPTDEQLYTEKERDFKEFFFQYSASNTEIDNNSETNVIADIGKRTVFHPKVSDIISTGKCGTE